VRRRVVDGMRSAGCEPALRRSPINGFENQWWAQLVGALSIHPYKHYADYPQKSDRRNFEVGDYL
jgi:hypothetical protein